MNDQDILALYDRALRRDVEYPDMRREAFPDLVRLVDLTGRQGAVIYSQLDEQSADATIEEQIAYFEGIRQDFEWKVFGYDHPPDLVARLKARGFEIDEEEALLIYDLDHAAPEMLAPVTHDIRQLTEPEQVAPAIAVLEQVWNGSKDWLAERLSTDLRERPETLRLYTAYADGKPVSAAWMYVNPGTPFAGLWGGSTLEGYRGRGLYSALLATRVQEARRLGVRFLTIDASPMSRPIVQKHGFRFMTLMHACVWAVDVDTTRL